MKSIVNVGKGRGLSLFDATEKHVEKLTLTRAKIVDFSLIELTTEAQTKSSFLPLFFSINAFFAFFFFLLFF